MSPGEETPARILTRCLLQPSDVQPEFEGFEVVGAFNPAAIAFEDGVALLVRVAERPSEVRKGHVALPRWDWRRGRMAIDWARLDEVEQIDPRIVRVRSTGHLRLTFLSRLLVAFSRDGLSIDRFGETSVLPSTRYEAFGVEDARLTRLDDRFYFTYVAVSEHGVATALASTEDFRSFRRHGVIFCPENKDVVLFPERIDGHYVALHRPHPNACFSAPEIWIARSPDLLHWGAHERVLGSEVGWATIKIGGGTPPLRTDRGWLSLFHGNITPGSSDGVGEYAAASMLLDLEDPRRVIGLSPQPVIRAQADFERSGFLPNVLFPTALLRRDDVVDVYYGAADTATGVARFALDELLATALT
ncbi:glycoside hydrolase family 130 protein [bacterium]|nr:glycoside hydrolase family 130 protein [bacterium]